jgi:hypothetical protein
MATEPTELYAGTLIAFGGSMAEDIEHALIALMGALPSAPEQLVADRRKLFIAIASGVIVHLQRKQAALEIEFDIGSVHVSTHPDIKVKS